MKSQDKPRWLQGTLPKAYDFSIRCPAFVMIPGLQSSPRDKPFLHQSREYLQAEA
jgi:hypothetical protein